MKFAADSMTLRRRKCRCWFHRCEFTGEDDRRTVSWNGINYVNHLFHMIRLENESTNGTCSDWNTFMLLFFIFLLSFHVCSLLHALSAICWIPFSVSLRERERESIAEQHMLVRVEILSLSKKLCQTNLTKSDKF